MSSVKVGFHSQNPLELYHCDGVLEIRGELVTTKGCNITENNRAIHSQQCATFGSYGIGESSLSAKRNLLNSLENLLNLINSQGVLKRYFKDKGFIVDDGTFEFEKVRVKST